jgi:hypothetical protein
MDETNPAYENFLNNMSRLRGNTRRVAASKFLQRENRPTVEGNARKINLITNILRMRRVNVGQMLSSLSTESAIGADQDVMDIKKTLSSILETLKAQEKFEMKQFLDMQRRQENLRRRNRESLLEGVGNRGLNLINRGVQKVLSPVTNIFSRILNGFIALVGGQILMGLIDVLTNPVVARVLLGITAFVEKVFPIVAGVVGSAVFGIIRLLDQMGLLVPMMYTVAGLAALSFVGRPMLDLGFSSFGPTRVGRLGGFKTAPRLKKMKMLFNPKMYKFFRFGLGRKFNKGGLVPGSGNTDTVPAMLTPGEVVISKPAVEKFGVMNLLNLNRAAGSSSKAKIKNGVTYANEGAVARQPTVSDMFTSLLSSLSDIENSDVGKALTDKSIPETLQLFSERMALPKEEQIKAAEGIKSTVFNRITRSLTTSDFANKMVTSESTPPNLLPFNKLTSTASELNIKSLFDDVLNKVNPQNDAPLNNDTFSIQLDSPNQNKLETLGLII